MTDQEWRYATREEVAAATERAMEQWREVLDYLAER
jgi:hypothetical protein